jgi:hypothetical protein
MGTIHTGLSAFSIFDAGPEGPELEDQHQQAENEYRAAAFKGRPDKAHRPECGHEFDDNCPKFWLWSRRAFGACMRPRRSSIIMNTGRNKRAGK